MLLTFRMPKLNASMSVFIPNLSAEIGSKGSELLLEKLTILSLTRP